MVRELLDYCLFEEPEFLTIKQQRKVDKFHDEFAALMKKRSPEAISAAQDFLLFRKYVCGHDTFEHMMTWHHELNTGRDNKYLRGIAGEDVCILSPRNSSKSTFLLQWVAYIIGTHVMQGISLKILYISYAIDAAIGKSRQIKAIIESDKYQETFPKVRKSTSKWGESEWCIDFEYAGLRTIDEAYTLVCAGLKGSINSRRCLVGNTLITTKIGDIPIYKLEDKIGLEVLSFNHSTNKNEWKKITGFSKSSSNQIYSIRDSLGNHLSCTHDHQIYEHRTRYYQDIKNIKIEDILITPDRISFVKSLSNIVVGNSTYVYDIEVEDNHNFFANNILVHNCHVCVIDDPQKDIDEAKNKSIQERMSSNYNNILKYTRYDGSRFVTLGTRMAKHDAYSRIFVPPYYKVITQKALISEALPGGKTFERSFWEPINDDAPGLRLGTLLKEREEDYESFLLQRQNELPETTAQGIHPTWIKYSWMPKQFERIVIGADTADSTEDNTNATAFVVVGVANDSLYVVDAWEGRIPGNVKKIDQIYDLWIKRKSDCKHPAIISVDQHRWSKGLSGDFQSYIEDIHHDEELDSSFASVGIERVSSSGRGEKIDRLVSHSYLFEKGRVFFNLISPKGNDDTELIPKIVEQITDYNPVDHNDLMDALEVAIYTARQYISGNLTIA